MIYYKKDPKIQNQMASIGTMTHDSMLKNMEELMGEKTEREEITVERAREILTKKLSAQIMLWNELKEVIEQSDDKVEIKKALERIEFLIEDNVYKLTEGLEWEEVKERVLAIADQE